MDRDKRMDRCVISISDLENTCIAHTASTDESPYSEIRISVMENTHTHTHDPHTLIIPHTKPGDEHTLTSPTPTFPHSRLRIGLRAGEAGILHSSLRFQGLSSDDLLSRVLWFIAAALRHRYPEDYSWDTLWLLSRTLMGIALQKRREIPRLVRPGLKRGEEECIRGSERDRVSGSLNSRKRPEGLARGHTHSFRL